MISPKNPKELSLMREGGRKLGNILAHLLSEAKPGKTLLSIENLAQREIKETGGTPSFQTVKGYRFATCLCINDVVVHGLPSRYVLTEGDLLTVDVGIQYKGFHTDTAWTKIIGRKDNEFLKTGQKALALAIGQAKVGNRIGHISKIIQDTIEGSGYSIVKSLVGHGVGKELHEEPQIPGFLLGSVEKTEKLAPGMTIAIEVIYAQGKGSVILEEDGWSVATRDGSPSVVFEHTVAVTRGDPVVLTKFKK